MPVVIRNVELEPFSAKGRYTHVVLDPLRQAFPFGLAQTSLESEVRQIWRPTHTGEPLENPDEHICLLQMPLDRDNDPH